MEALGVSVWGKGSEGPTLGVGAVRWVWPSRALFWGAVRGLGSVGGCVCGGGGFVPLWSAALHTRCHSVLHSAALYGFCCFSPPFPCGRFSFMSPSCCPPSCWDGGSLPDPLTACLKLCVSRAARPAGSTELSLFCLVANGRVGALVWAAGCHWQRATREGNGILKTSLDF